MKSWGLPLWDLLMGRKARGPVRPVVGEGEKGGQSQSRAPVEEGHSPASSAGENTGGSRASRGSRKSGSESRPTTSRPITMAERYERVVRLMLAEHGVKVRKWRSGMSGVAWELKYHDGSVKRLIESPRPRGPMSMAIFLHEIGHHAIGFNRYKPRCLEEYHAWKFAIEQMEAHGLNVTASVRRRMHGSLHYAIGKARRRGLASLPVELEAFVEPPPRSGRKRRR